MYSYVSHADIIKIGPDNDEAKMIALPTTNDTIYWNYLWLHTCKNLLMLHKTLSVEKMADSASIEKWLVDVVDSKLLELGKYREYPIVDNGTFDESVSKEQRQMLNPQLVSLRERAIVLATCGKPEFYEYMLGVESEIRTQYKPAPVLKSLTSPKVPRQSLHIKAGTEVRDDEH